MSGRILVYTREAGGADCLVPVVKILLEAGVDVSVWLQQPALDIFVRHGLPGVRLPSDIAASFDQMSPTLLLTSASSASRTRPRDRFLWRCARERRVRSISVVDQWQHYEDRFLDPSTGDLIFPDVIAIPDQSSLGAIGSLAQGRADVVVTGRPGLDSEIDRIRAAQFDGRPLKILFVSEPLHRYLRPVLHYDERDVLELLVRALRNLDTEVELCVRPHPANTEADVKALLKTNAPFRIKRDDAIASNDFHLVVGMRSVFLLKSIVAGVATLSVQLAGPSDQQCVAVDKGLIPRIGHEEMLRETLRRLVTDAGFRESYLRRQSRFSLPKHAAHTIADMCVSFVAHDLRSLLAHG
jgi:hypothetical protein